MANYACSDIHGNLNLWTQICNFLTPTDTLYCLGDVIDRGPDGLAILDSIRRNPSIIFIPGNHEHMMLYCIDLLLKETLAEDEKKDIQCWLGENGGQATLDKLEQIDYFDTEKWILSCPHKIELINAANKKIILTHSGFTPWFKEYDPLHPLRDTSYIWDRDHILDFGKNFTTPEWSNTYIVHGHTPVDYIKVLKYGWQSLERFKKPTVLNYSFKHKFCIDMGTYDTKTACLFDLDTFDARYFYDT